jgi:hypothetical protein
MRMGLREKNVEREMEHLEDALQVFVLEWQSEAQIHF